MGGQARAQESGPPICLIPCHHCVLYQAHGPGNTQGRQQQQPIEGGGYARLSLGPAFFSLLGSCLQASHSSRNWEDGPLRAPSPPLGFGASPAQPNFRAMAVMAYLSILFYLLFQVIAHPSCPLEEPSVGYINTIHHKTIITHFNKT